MPIVSYLTQPGSSTSPFDPAVPEYLRIRSDEVNDIFAGHLDRDNIKLATLPESAFAVGSTNLIAAKEPDTNTSTGADARDGLILFDEAIFGSDGAFLDFISGDSAVVVTSKTVVRFEPTNGGTDIGMVTAGLMVDGQIVARADRTEVSVEAAGTPTAYTACLKGAISVPGGAHRAIAFIELEGFNGYKVTSIKLGERFIMVEEMVR